MNENLLNKNDEQIPYGVYEKKSGNSKIVLDQQLILARSLITFTNNGDNVYMQTSSEELSVNLENTKLQSGTDIKETRIHDQIDHGIFVPIAYASGNEIFGSASEDEEGIATLSALLRKAKYIFTFHDKEYLIDKVESIISKINFQNKKLSKIIESLKVDPQNVELLESKDYIESQITYCKRIQAISTFELNINIGLEELAKDMRSAEKIFIRMHKGIENGMNLTVEHIVTEKLIPQATIEIMKSINLK